MVLNAIMTIAIIGLYYLHFFGQHEATAARSVSAGNLKLAYINSDSVLKYYDYFKVNRVKLEAKVKKLDQDLKNRATSLQGEIESYQRNVNSMTIGQARAVEEDLGKKRQNLQLYQESLSQQMQGDQEKMTKDLYNKVTAYLKKYGQERGLQVVFKYDATSDLLFGGDSLDISADVTKGLNEAYQLEQATPAKSDSIANKKK